MAMTLTVAATKGLHFFDLDMTVVAAEGRKHPG
jgi:hypothetical protein